MADNLSKFGVPIGQPGTLGLRDGILQPKLKYRFRVVTQLFGANVATKQADLTKQVMNVTKPKLSFEEVQIDSYNSRIWVAGKHTWEMVTLVVRDDITNIVSRLVGGQMQKQLNHFEQTAPTAGNSYKFSMNLEIMDGGNDFVQETWVLEGCWLQNVDYDSLDYAAGAEMQIITMQVRFDNATQLDGLFPFGSAGDNNGLSPVNVGAELASRGN